MSLLEMFSRKLHPLCMIDHGIELRDEDLHSHKLIFAECTLNADSVVCESIARLSMTFPHELGMHNSKLFTKSL